MKTNKKGTLIPPIDTSEDENDMETKIVEEAANAGRADTLSTESKSGNQDEDKLVLPTSQECKVEPSNTCRLGKYTEEPLAVKQTGDEVEETILSTP